MKIRKMDKYFSKLGPMLEDAEQLITPTEDSMSEEFRESYLASLKVLRLLEAYEKSTEAVDYLDSILMMSIKSSRDTIKSVKFIDEIIKSDVTSKKNILNLLKIGES